jgi:DNA repair protein RadC
MTNPIIKKALKIMESEAQKTHDKFGNSDFSKDYFRLLLGNEKEEVFAVAFLNNQHKLIACEKMFRGTIDEAAVYPRAIVRKVIELNASKVILSHNHPSGCVNPSRADEEITYKLRDILSVIDCKVLDHIIVSATETYSFAEVLGI